MVMGAPLEDARHLAQRYDRMRQEAEAQVFTIKHSIFNSPSFLHMAYKWSIIKVVESLKYR
jgi:hypothetical protein